jgi:hypothetical protein
MLFLAADTYGTSFADYVEELSHEGTKARRKLTADMASSAILQMANWSLPHTVLEIHFCDQLFGIDLGCRKQPLVKPNFLAG